MITVNERSTMSFDITVTDANGDPVSLDRLTSIRWQLSDISGNVINNRTFENGLITEGPVVLTDDDLAITTRSICDVKRAITVKVVYTSDLGPDLNATEEAQFIIDDLINIT